MTGPRVLGVGVAGLRRGGGGSGPDQRRVAEDLVAHALGVLDEVIQGYVDRLGLGAGQW